MDSKKHKCTSCEKSYSHKRSLDAHLRHHSGERPFECTICNKKFLLKGTLNEHTKIHSEVKPFKCPTCSKEFSQKKYMTTHMQIHSGVAYKCPTCQKDFNSKTGLDHHSKIHDIDRKIECQVCKKSYLGKANLTKHMTIHAPSNVNRKPNGKPNGKPYLCVPCHQRFFIKSDIISHLLVHSGEVSIICLKCKQAFTKSLFLGHLSIHDEQKKESDVLNKESRLVFCYNGSKDKAQGSSRLDAVVKGEIIESSNSESCNDRSIIIENLDEQTLGSNQVIKQEPTVTADITWVNQFDDSFIKEETDI